MISKPRQRDELWRTAASLVRTLGSSGLGINNQHYLRTSPSRLPGKTGLLSGCNAAPIIYLHAGNLKRGAALMSSWTAGGRTM